MATGIALNGTFTLDDSSGSPLAITTSCRNVKVNESSDSAKTTAYGDQKDHRLAGFKDSSLDADGVHKTATHDAALYYSLRRSRTYAREQVASGGTSYSGECIGTKYTLEFPYDKEITWSWSAAGTGVVTRA